MSRQELLERSRAAVVLIALAGLFGWADEARAYGRSAPDLKRLVEGSELILLGRVVDIRYALSEPPAEGAGGIPHTFVTYQVRQVVRGKIDPESAKKASGREGRTVTLRFAGGPRPSDGAILRVSSVPRFDVGDVDILFVRGNGIANCPLSEWLNGRMRVIDGRLYSEEGQEIIRTERGLGWGAKHDFPEVTSHKIGDKVYEQRRDKDGLDGEEAEAAVPLEKGKALEAEALLTQLAKRFGDAPSRHQPVKSANPEEPFAGPVAAPVPPPPATSPNNR